MPPRTKSPKRKTSAKRKTSIKRRTPTRSVHGRRSRPVGNPKEDENEGITKFNLRTTLNLDTLLKQDSELLLMFNKRLNEIQKVQLAPIPSVSRSAEFKNYENQLMDILDT